jgi:hypothetical protein
MKKIKFIFPALTLSCLVALFFVLTSLSKDKEIPLDYPKIKVETLPDILGKVNIVDYEIDSLNGDLYCITDHPGNDDTKGVKVGPDKYKFKQLALYRLAGKKWEKVGEEYDEYVWQSLFTFEGKVYWAVSLSYKLNSRKNYDKACLTTVYKVDEGKLEIVHRNVPGEVTGFVRYKEKFYVYGEFEPDAMPANKVCGMMEIVDKGFEPIYIDVVPKAYSSYALFNTCQIFNGKLCFCGSIYANASNGKLASSLIAWDGSKWSALDYYLKGAGWYSDIQTYKDRLYVSGAFISANRKPIDINNVISFDKNGELDNLQAGFALRGGDNSASVSNMCLFQDKLLFSGSFGSAGRNKGIHDLALWDGNSFLPIIESSAGLPTRVIRAIPYKNKLFIYGFCEKVNDVKVNRKAWLVFED